MTSTTVKTVLERKEPPTSAKVYWSRLPGRLVERFTGEDKAKLNITDPLEWNETVLRLIEDQSSYIHKKSLRCGAQFVVANDFGFCILESLVSYRPLMFGEPNSNIGVEFDDAVQMGVINNKYAVFKSASIEPNKILIGLAGNGLDYIVNYVSSTPEIEVVCTDNPYKQREQVAYWNYLEILDIELYRK